ncbi:type II secretion system protein GspM [Persephonella sp.]
MRQILLYLENLEKRERYILIGGLYAVIIIVGLFFTALPTYEKIQQTERKITKEMENYRQLMEAVSVYLSVKGSVRKKEISLSQIEKIATATGVKDRIILLKPYQDAGVEVSLEEVNWSSLVSFLKRVKQENYTLVSFSMEKPKEKPVVKARLVITE